MLASIPGVGNLFAGLAAFGHGVRNRVEGTLKMANEATFDEGERQRARGDCQIAIGAAAAGALGMVLAGSAEAVSRLYQACQEEERG
jgi:hypothetical protein